MVRAEPETDRPPPSLGALRWSVVGLRKVDPPAFALLERRGPSRAKGPAAGARGLGQAQTPHPPSRRHLGPSKRSHAAFAPAHPIWQACITLTCPY